MNLSSNHSSRGWLPRLMFDRYTGEFSYTRMADNPQPLQYPFQMLIDLQEAEPGWVVFEQGQNGVEPEYSFGKIGEPDHTDITEQHIKCFRLLVMNDQFQLRHFVDSTPVVRKALDALYDKFEFMQVDKTDKVPLVEIEGTHQTTVYTQNGQEIHHAPIWRVVGMVDRPEKMVAPEETADTEDPRNIQPQNQDMPF